MSMKTFFYFQPDKYNQINLAWFQPNGGCGYVLKPKYLR